MNLQRAHRSSGGLAARIAWNIVYTMFYRFSPTILHGWRRFLLRCFGARIGPGAHPYPTARVWAPWNLTMGKDSCLGHHANCYSVGPVVLGDGSVVSQNAHLCSASHDYRDPAFPLLVGPIEIGPLAWVAADVFVGPGVTIGEGAVLGARSVVFKDVPAWAVVVGNPAKIIKYRQLEGHSTSGNAFAAADTRTA